MHRLTSHLRGLLVAVATLALTAGVAFAARPTGDTGLERATDAAGRPVPAEQAGDHPAVPEPNEDDEELEENEPEVDGEDGAEADGEHPDNHGWYVSEAAKGPTPDSYRNHGEYVSEIARGDDGKKVKGDDEETAEGDDEAETTRSAGPGRSGEAKARNAERKAGRGGG